MSDASADVHRHSIWPDAALIGVAIIWGVNIPVMKIGLEQIDVYVFNALRLSISTFVLTVFAFLERRRGVVPKATISFKRVAGYAFMVSATYQVLFLLGVARTTSGNTALIMATVPMWTALLAYWFIGERLRPLAWGGLAIALVGTIIVAMQKDDVAANARHLLGNLIILAAALLWAAGTVYSRPLLTKISPLQLAASAGAVALPFHSMLAVNGFAASLPALKSGSLWLTIIFSGVLSSGLAQPMWHYGVRHSGASHAAIVQNLIPLVAIVAAWLSRGEGITTAQLIGGALILLGLIVMRLRRQALGGIASQDLTA